MVKYLGIPKCDYEWHDREDRRHICNRDNPSHDDDHKCVCGQTRRPTTQDIWKKVKEEREEQ